MPADAGNTDASRVIEEVVVSSSFSAVGGVFSGKADVVGTSDTSCFTDDRVSLRVGGISGVGIKTCSGSQIMARYQWRLFRCYLQTVIAEKRNTLFIYGHNNILLLKDVEFRGPLSQTFKCLLWTRGHFSFGYVCMDRETHSFLWTNFL